MPRLSFSLRDVFWLTLVVGLILAHFYTTQVGRYQLVIQGNNRIVLDTRTGESWAWIWESKIWIKETEPLSRPK